MDGHHTRERRGAAFLTLDEAFERVRQRGHFTDKQEFFYALEIEIGHGAVTATGLKLGPAPGSRTVVIVIISHDRVIIPPTAMIDHSIDGDGSIITDDRWRGWAGVAVPTGQIDGIWPERPVTEQNRQTLEQMLRAVVDERGGKPPSQAEAEKIARDRGYPNPRKEIRDTLQTIAGPAKSGPKGPRKNPAR